MRLRLIRPTPTHVGRASAAPPAKTAPAPDAASPYPAYNGPVGRASAAPPAKPAPAPDAASPYPAYTNPRRPGKRSAPGMA